MIWQKISYKLLSSARGQCQNIKKYNYLINFAIKISIGERRGILLPLASRVALVAIAKPSIDQKMNPRVVLKSAKYGLKIRHAIPEKIRY